MKDSINIAYFIYKKVQQVYLKLIALHQKVNEHMRRFVRLDIIGTIKKTVKSTDRVVALLVKLQYSAGNFTKNNNPL